LIERKLARLAELGFSLLPATEIRSHYIFERDGFVALVARQDDGFGGVGSPGLLTEKGFAALVWRGEKAWFVAHGFEQQATDEQTAKVRGFSRDLEEGLSS
jgi:hypothetical protein